jgi:CheY-like chemotaxis protein
MPRILIADDSRTYVQLISGWVKDRGFEVVVASEAIQALVMPTNVQPDAGILDISMPGGSGIDVLKKLKPSTKTKHIPVLVVNGNAGAEMRLVKRLGAADLLEKPSDWTRFCDILASLVVGSSPHRRPANRGRRLESFSAASNVLFPEIWIEGTRVSFCVGVGFSGGRLLAPCEWQRAESHLLRVFEGRRLAPACRARSRLPANSRLVSTITGMWASPVAFL